MGDRWISLLGLFVMLFLAWCMSAHKTKISLRVVLGGLGIQLLFAVLVLKTDAGRNFFQSVGDVFTVLLDYVDAGAGFVFGANTFKEHYFAFKVLPTIVFFSALMSLLYYLGVMQFIVKIVAIAMQKTLGTSGAESLSASANIFVGQTEAPLVIKPYVKTMTQSELMAVMVGGFATIAGGVMAAFIGMGINATDLLTASVLSAPAALVVAKIMQPEVEEPMTRGSVKLDVEKNGDNMIHAAANGAADGVKLAINVAGMLIAFMALIAMFNGLIGWVGIKVGAETKWSLEAILGFIFYPIAWALGIASQDCDRIGQLLGIRLIASEFNAYTQLSEWLRQGVPMEARSVALATYALCGFSTFASIGIQLGGIGPLAPERTGDLARLGLRAMLGGNLASFMTACVAGVLLTDADFQERSDRFKKYLEETQKALPAPTPGAPATPETPAPPSSDPKDAPAKASEKAAEKAATTEPAKQPAAQEPAAKEPPPADSAGKDTKGSEPPKETGPPEK
jgi:CNT family concentrative nucleoside transporter